MPVPVLLYAQNRWLGEEVIWIFGIPETRFRTGKHANVRHKLVLEGFFGARREITVRRLLITFVGWRMFLVNFDRLGQVIVTYGYQKYNG